MHDPLLTVNGLQVAYGGSRVLQGVDLVLDHRVTTIVGRNGMGKTTLVQSIMGLVPVQAGTVTFRGRPITGLAPHQIASMGIGYVPQGRRLFASLTVDEHLRLAARRAEDGPWDPNAVYAMFPNLKRRRHQLGCTLSGGEQQMLAIGRALVANPMVLIMDEPSEGLAPVIVDQVGSICRELIETGIQVLVVEQNLHLASSLASETHVMVTGKIAYTGGFETLLSDPDLTRRYLGVDVMPQGQATDQADTRQQEGEE